jgi:hypothetical protein
MRAESFGRQALLSDGCERLASFGSRRWRFDGYRQRSLGQILAHHTVAMIVVPRRTGVIRRLMLVVIMWGSMVVMMMGMPRPMMMVAFRLGHLRKLVSPMIVEKPMSTPNDNRHQRITGGKQVGQGWPNVFHYSGSQKCQCFASDASY